MCLEACLGPCILLALQQQYFSLGSRTILFPRPHVKTNVGPVISECMGVNKGMKEPTDEYKKQKKMVFGEYIKVRIFVYSNYYFESIPF